MTRQKKLNPEQIKVVDLTEGPILVLAGPGTGKTQLLSARTANIIKNKKALPENILILTFTNSAAKAMKERLAEILGEDGFKVEVSTYHSFARNYIILDSEEAINYIGERIQISDVEKTRAIEYILDTVRGIDPIRPFGAPYVYRSEIEKKISELKNEGVSPPEFYKHVENLIPDGNFIEEKHIPRLKALAKVYEEYETLKTGRNKDIFDQRGRFDYDDMIIIATEVFKKEPSLRERYMRQYQYVMVDEFQDSNGAQLELLFNLVSDRHPNLCCVGDDDQSIYRFQGANVGNFRALQKHFPEVSVITLRSNYRSTREIIEVSSKIINNVPGPERFQSKELIPKAQYSKKTIEFFEFSTEHEELLFIIKKVLETKRQIEESKDLPEEDRKKAYNNIAILARKRDYILKIINALLAAGIPYSTDGKEDISQERRVRQLMDVLDLAHLNIKGSEEDLALFKVLSSDYFRIPMSGVLSFIAATRKKKTSGILEELLKNPPEEFKRAARAIANLLEDARSKPLHSMLMQYIHDSGIYAFILKGYDKNKTMKIRDLRAITSFLNIVKGSDQSRPGIGLDDFMQEIRIKKDHNIPIQGELATLSQNGVRVYTAHGSKGQEFHTVIIPFCVQDKSWPLRPIADKLPLPPGIYKAKEIPKDKKRLRQLMEYDETRLFYVAASRAKANLIFTASPAEDNVVSSYLHAIGVGPKKPGIKKEDELLLESLKLKYDDNLSGAGTNKAVKDLVKDLALTPTKLNNYLKCKRKFFYDSVLKLPGKKRQGLVFGNCAHKALEETYRKFKDEDRFPDFPFFEEVFKTELKFQGADKSIERGCLDKLEILRAWFDIAKTDPVKPLGLEKQIPITVGKEAFFVGKYDKLELEDEERSLVRVIDYKTGRPDKYIKAILNFNGELTDDESNDYIRQLTSYKILFEKGERSGGVKTYKVSHGVLIFLEPVEEDAPKYGLKKGEFRNEKLEITPAMVAALERSIQEAWKDIQGLKFDKLDGRSPSKCENCDFDSICWG